MSEHTLKPCPFCGGAAEFTSLEFREVSEHAIVCEVCGAMHWANNPPSDLDIAGWNTRAPDPTLAQQQEEIGRLRSALEPVLKAIDASDWHDVNGERMKRVLVAQTAIDRTRAALESRHAD